MLYSWCQPLKKPVYLESVDTLVLASLPCLSSILPACFSNWWQSLINDNVFSSLQQNFLSKVSKVLKHKLLEQKQATILFYNEDSRKSIACRPKNLTFGFWCRLRSILYSFYKNIVVLIDYCLKKFPIALSFPN